MPKEIELKLRLNPAQARRLAGHPVFSGMQPQKYKLFNTYYDTPDLALCRRGIALRMRCKGRAEWLMTVKGGDPAGGALARRSEWEVPTRPGIFIFDAVDDRGLRNFLKSCQTELRPVFSTNFTRITWTVHRAGALVEIALDRGKINADCLSGGEIGACAPICELELELIEGTTSDALFDVAIELASDFQLHPAIASKAERGYALAQGQLGLPAKAMASTIDRAMSPGEAFRALALSCVLHLQRNEDGVLAGQDAEYLHQARIALRRLRACFRLFAPVLESAFVAVYLPRWRDLARQLGVARDWDVFVNETLLPLEKNFPEARDLARALERAETRRAGARVAASAVLGRKAYSQLLLAFTAALLRDRSPTIVVPGTDSADMRKFAVQRLRRRVAAIRKIAGEDAALDDERRHRLRIALKNLRYALEFFAPLLPRKRVKRYQDRLVAIQDFFGRLNDQATAQRLLKDFCADADGLPLGDGWVAGRKHLLVAAQEGELADFLASPLPW